MNINMILVVWGQKYVTDCLNDMLPLLLTPGNLPAWPWLSTTRLCVFTTPKDWTCLESAPLWQELGRYVEIVPMWIDTPATDSVHKYDLLTTLHQQAIQSACQESRSLIFLAPDLLLPEDSLQQLAEAMAAGVQGLLTLGLYVQAESVQVLLADRLKGSKPYLPQSLALQWLADYLHPRIRQAFWDNSQWVQNPAAVGYQRSDGHSGFRSFCLHPIFIRQPRPMSIPDTIDASYLQQYADEIEQWHILQPEQFLCLTLQEDAASLETWEIRPDQRLLFLYQYASHLGEQMPVAYRFFAEEIVFPTPLGSRPSATGAEPLHALSWLLQQEEWYRQQQWSLLLNEPWPELPWPELLRDYPLLGLLYDLRLSAWYHTAQWEQLQAEVQAHAAQIQAIPVCHSRVRHLDYLSDSELNIDTVLGYQPQQLQVVTLSEKHWLNPEDFLPYLEPEVTLVLLASQWTESEWELWQAQNWPGEIYFFTLAQTAEWKSCVKVAQQIWIPQPLEPAWESLVLMALLQGKTVRFW